MQTTGAVTGRRVELTAGHALALAALVGVAALLFSYAVLAVNWQRSPYLGVLLAPDGTVAPTYSLAQTPTPAEAAGLRIGDRVTAVADQTLLSDYRSVRDRLSAALAGHRPGDAIPVVFERASGADEPIPAGCTGEAGILRCTVSVMLTIYPVVDFIVQFGLSWLVGLAALVTAAAVVVRGWTREAARPVAFLLMALAVVSAGVFDLQTMRQLSPQVTPLALALLGGVLLLLALDFPARLSIVRRRPVVQTLPALATLVVVLILFALPEGDPGGRWAAGAGWAAVGVIGLAGTQWWRIRRAISPALRSQSALALLSLLLALVPALVWALSVGLRLTFFRQGLGFHVALVTPFLLLPPAAMLYALTADVSARGDRLISQSIVYGTLALLITLGYGLLVTGVTLLTGSVVQVNNPLVVAATLFLAAVAFGPLRNALERQVEQAYYRTRRRYRERVEQLGRDLTHATSLGEIVAAIRAQIDSTLVPTHSFLFFPHDSLAQLVAYGEPSPETDIRFALSSPLLRFLAGWQEALYLDVDDGLPAEAVSERSRLAVLGAPVLIALRGRERLSGLLVVGPRRSGERYTFDDLAFLQSLADQAALAVERVQAVASLEQRMREMNVLGQVAQAANYATDFDELLWQLYSQINLLVRAPHFAIALRDPNTDELYYAIVVEEGQRRTEYVGIRWRMGRDLLSEIVRGGQPVRLEDYGAELQRRGHSAPYDNADLKAWIGVPLSGPEGPLGVMSVGSRGPDLTYSDEQLRILWQVADQAAVAIDKARLFRETETRARQLTALNEISRELATVFHDSERLLELITESAVEILEAEAGSLLMIVPDTQELEFKVVVGSQAQSLVGTRLPPGTGLVGTVADRGEPIIVNDASRDPRWFAGVDRNLDFRTSTVLAAPLIGNSGVIGVLEVINKRDGGVFVEDDRRLLVAFAGQASIAIENARLFQMTDEQLAARVDELDTMQRIDRELNETLKLERVMSITLEWAMRESAATAGALGMLVTEPYGLRVMVHQGYPPETFTGDRLWPLERGCLERVVRTGQPEVVSDVLLDAEGTAILPGARCQMVVPLFSEGQVSGLILLESVEENAFSLLHLDFISRLAEHASPALANAILLSQLEQANEARSEFVGFVAHELKTPMTSIQGFADLLLGGVVGPLNDQQKRFLSTIRSNIERMNTLVSDLNDVTKLQTNRMSMDKAAIDFREVVLETLRPLQNQIDGKQQTVRLELANALPLIWADQNRMIQVLTNLITNANKYTPAGGEIVIHAAPSRNHWDSTGAPEVLHIYVRDNGIGISQDDQARLFTPYFRTTNPQAMEQPGTGLGLVIVRGIVEQHGGRIWVESQPGQGSTFHLTVPLASAVPEAQARAN